MPFAAQRRHQTGRSTCATWTGTASVGRNIYVISILDNYSRAILASGLSRTQDLTAYLLVLYAAIRQHGAPEALVSDGGSVFKAKQALRIYDALGIRKEQIARKQPWQNYIETTFNIMRRMADWEFRPRGDLGGTPRRARSVGGRLQLPGPLGAPGPRGGAQARPTCCPGCMAGIHAGGTASRLLRDPLRARPRRCGGYVPSFRHWRLYGERGLVAMASLWLYDEHLRPLLPIGDGGRGTPLEHRISHLKWRCGSEPDEGLTWRRMRRSFNPPLDPTYTGHITWRGVPCDKSRA